MGRHAADRPATEPDGAFSARPPLHADLFVPHGGRSERGRQPDGDVFDTLVAQHQDALHGYVLRLTDGDENATESILKETYYRAAQNPARYPQRASAVRPWLVLIARTVTQDGDRQAPAGHDDRPARRHRPRNRHAEPATTVVRALEDLSGVHRDILVELFYRGVSLEEAADVRGVPVETVKSRLYFAMRALHVVLDQQVADRHDAP